MIAALAAIAMSAGLEAAPKRGEYPRERRGQKSSEAGPEINQGLMNALRQFAEAYNSGNKDKARAIARRLQNRIGKIERPGEGDKFGKQDRPAADKRQKMQEQRKARQERHAARQEKRKEGKDMRQRRKESGNRNGECRIDREALREKIAARRRQFIEQRRQYAQSRRGRDGQTMRRRPQMQDRDRQEMPRQQMGRRGGFERMGPMQRDRMEMQGRGRRAPQERRGGQEQPRFFEVY